MVGADDQELTDEAPPELDAGTIELSEELVAVLDLDPFTPRVAFAEARGATVKTWFENCQIAEFVPLDTRADKLVDLDKLAELTEFEGLIRRPTVMAEEDYPFNVSEAMRELEPQFVLRNLARVERLGDPEDQLPFEREKFEAGLNEDPFAEVRAQRYTPPEWLEDMNLGRVIENRSFMKGLYHETNWERHFSREIKADHAGPMWTYDPDARRDGDTSADDASAGKGTASTSPEVQAVLDRVLGRGPGGRG